MNIVEVDVSSKLEVKEIIANNIACGSKFAPLGEPPHEVGVRFGFKDNQKQ